MPGNLSASLLAALQAEGCQAFFVWEITFPSATRRLAYRDIASAAAGQYEGVVLSALGVHRAVSDRDNALQLSTTGLTFECTDFAFQRELEGSSAQNVRGSAVVMKLGAVGVTTANWATVFTGKLDTYKRAGPLTWVLTFHSDDKPLRNVFPKLPVLQSDWPNVGDLSLYATWVPVIYGIHDSRGSGDAGMVPCLYVDTIGFRYLVALGWVTVDRVYKDGALQASGYTADHTTINGRLYTLINFTADQAKAVITADVTGYESVGNGTGATLTGADALAHLLTNFVYGDYQGGNWPATNAIVDTTTFAAAQTFLVAMNWQKVSKRFGGADQTTGIDALNQFCSSLQLYGYFTRTGKLALAPDEHRTYSLFKDEPAFIRWDQDQVGDDFDVDYDRDGLMSRIALSFVFGSAANQYMQTTEIRDNSSTEEATSSLPLPWSNASLL